MDFKVKIILVIAAILVIVGASGLDFSKLSGASLISSSEIRELDGTAYNYIYVGEKSYNRQDVGVVKYVGSEDVDVDGEINSDGDAIEGDFDVKLEIKVNDLGWAVPVTSYSETFVNHMWMTGWAIKKMNYEEGIVRYYQATGSMNPIASYDVIATVNGRKYFTTINAENRGQVEIPGTDPVIYWDEGSFGITRDANIPIGVGNVDILKDTGGNVKFLKKDATIEMINYWNAIMKDDYRLIYQNAPKWGLPPISLDFPKVNRRIDFNGDGKYDLESSEKYFTVNDLIHNTYQWKTCDLKLTLLCISPKWIDFPSSDKYPYKSSQSTTGFSMGSHAGDQVLKRDGILIIKGVWKIPLEYGDVRVKTYYPEPKIIGEPSFSETIFEGTTTTVTVDVKNIGNDDGPISVWATSRDRIVQLVLPDTIVKNIDKGETERFVLRFKGEEPITKGTIAIWAQGTGGKTSVNLEYTVIALPDEDDTSVSKHRITITAVDEKGLPMGAYFPITVSQNSLKRYGIWVGNLMPGTTSVFGEEVVIDGNTYYPKDFNINVQKSGEYNLVYTTDRPEGREGEPIDYVKYILYIVGILILLASYSYMKKRNSKSKRR